MKNPCIDCKSRKKNCKDTCDKEEYIKWTDAMEAMRKDKERNRMLDGYFASSAARNERRLHCYLAKK